MITVDGKMGLTGFCCKVLQIGGGEIATADHQGVCPGLSSSMLAKVAGTPAAL